ERVSCASVGAESRSARATAAVVGLGSGSAGGLGSADGAATEIGSGSSGWAASAGFGVSAGLAGAEASGDDFGAGACPRDCSTLGRCPVALARPAEAPGPVGRAGAPAALGRTGDTAGVVPLTGGAPGLLARPGAALGLLLGT